MFSKKMGCPLDVKCPPKLVQDIVARFVGVIANTVLDKN